jgi:hypothetical protein
MPSSRTGEMLFLTDLGGVELGGQLNIRNEEIWSITANFAAPWGTLMVDICVVFQCIGASYMREDL